MAQNGSGYPTLVESELLIPVAENGVLFPTNEYKSSHTTHMNFTNEQEPVERMAFASQNFEWVTTK
jgi:hypothetical protein